MYYQRKLSNSKRIYKKIQHEYLQDHFSDSDACFTLLKVRDLLAQPKNSTSGGAKGLLLSLLTFLKII